jgi:hypothetical protein
MYEIFTLVDLAGSLTLHVLPVLVSATTALCGYSIMPSCDYAPPDLNCWVSAARLGRAFAGASPCPLLIRAIPS